MSSGLTEPATTLQEGNSVLQWLVESGNARVLDSSSPITDTDTRSQGPLVIRVLDNGNAIIENTRASNDNESSDSPNELSVTSEARAAAHRAIYGTRPPSPHPGVPEFWRLPPARLSATTSRSSQVPPHMPAHGRIAHGDVPDSALMRNVASGVSQPTAPTPTSTTPPDTNPAHPSNDANMCDVCMSNDSTMLGFVGCTHRLCDECINSIYNSHVTGAHVWPSRIPCHMCRSSVRMVIDQRGEQVRLPTWVLAYSLDARMRLVATDLERSEPVFMRSWIRYHQTLLRRGL